MRKINLNHAVALGLSWFQIWLLTGVSLASALLVFLIFQVRGQAKAAEKNHTALHGLLSSLSDDMVRLRDQAGVNSRLGAALKELPTTIVQVGSPPPRSPAGPAGQSSGDSRQPASLPPVRPTGATPQVAPAPRYGRNDAAAPPQPWSTPPGYTEPQLPPPSWLNKSPENTTTFPEPPMQALPAPAVEMPSQAAPDAALAGSEPMYADRSTASGDRLQDVIKYQRIHTAQGAAAANQFWEEKYPGDPPPISSEHIDVILEENKD